jgi:hypothetical protein
MRDAATEYKRRDGAYSADLNSTKPSRSARSQEWAARAQMDGRAGVHSCSPGHYNSALITTLGGFATDYRPRRNYCDAPPLLSCWVRSFASLCPISSVDSVHASGKPTFYRCGSGEVKPSG